MVVENVFLLGILLYLRSYFVDFSDPVISFRGVVVFEPEFYFAHASMVIAFI